MFGGTSVCRASCPRFVTLLFAGVDRMCAMRGSLILGYTLRYNVMTAAGWKCVRIIFCLLKPMLQVNRSINGVSGNDSTERLNTISNRVSGSHATYLEVRQKGSIIIDRLFCCCAEFRTVCIFARTIQLLENEDCDHEIRPYFNFQ